MHACPFYYDSQYVYFWTAVYPILFVLSYVGFVLFEFAQKKQSRRYLFLFSRKNQYKKSLFTLKPLCLFTEDRKDLLRLFLENEKGYGLDYVFVISNCTKLTYDEKLCMGYTAVWGVHLLRFKVKQTRMASTRNS